MNKKEKLKNIIITNAINILTFICILFLHNISALIGNILLFTWLIYFLFSNYQIMVKSENIYQQLKKADKENLFQNENYELTLAIQSIEAQKEKFQDYDLSNSIRKSYDLIYEKVYHNAFLAIKFMNQYDYITCPKSTYLTKLVKNSKEMVKKLNELNDLILQIDDSTSEVDITYVDDMLDSMKTVLKEGY